MTCVRWIKVERDLSDLLPTDVNKHRMAYLQRHLTLVRGRWPWRGTSIMTFLQTHAREAAQAQSASVQGSRACAEKLSAWCTG